MGTRAIFAFVVMAAILQGSAFAASGKPRRELLTHRVQAVKPTIGSGWRARVNSRIASASISTASSSTTATTGASGSSISTGSDAATVTEAAATSSNTATARVAAAGVGNSSLGAHPAAVSATLGTTTVGTSATCDASSLADYASSTQLSSDLTLHWKAASATKVNLALEAAAGSSAAAGWFSVAFSRVSSDGSIPVNVGGSNTLIWAYSESGSKSLDFHGENDGVATVDFSCDGSSSSAPPSTSPPSSPAPPSTSPPSSSPPSTSPPSTSPPSSSSSCATSTLPSYTYSAPLDSSLTLHWKTVSATQVNLALEAAAGSTAAAGWFSLAWTADGRMAPADTIIGNLPGGAVAAYYMSGYGMSDVQPTSSFSIGSGAALTTTSSGSKVMKFSRAQGDGSIPVSVNGSNTLIWGYSQGGSQTLGFHGENDGALTLDFSCATSSTGGGIGGGVGGGIGGGDNNGGGFGDGGHGHGQGGHGHGHGGADGHGGDMGKTQNHHDCGCGGAGIWDEGGMGDLGGRSWSESGL
ncbi:hypothetical protein CLOP_g17945 [Closterium sp. NIES-67]|nr:hypothetical protein CLOP_g17945 [Closterium sp. NIES-67]